RGVCVVFDDPHTLVRLSPALAGLSLRTSEPRLGDRRGSRLTTGETGVGVLSPRNYALVVYRCLHSRRGIRTIPRRLPLTAAGDPARSWAARPAAWQRARR